MIKPPVKAFRELAQSSPVSAGQPVKKTSKGNTKTTEKQAIKNECPPGNPGDRSDDEGVDSDLSAEVDENRFIKYFNNLFISLFYSNITIKITKFK
jgi:hypothetical protein